MKLRVDSNRCQGHTLCHLVAPDLFALSEIDGHASPTVDEIPEEMIGVALNAADGCPEQAISVYRAD